MNQNVGGGTRLLLTDEALQSVIVTDGAGANRDRADTEQPVPVHAGTRGFEVEGHQTREGQGLAQSRAPRACILRLPLRQPLADRNGERAANAAALDRRDEMKHWQPGLNDRLNAE